MYIAGSAPLLALLWSAFYCLLRFKAGRVNGWNEGRFFKEFTDKVQAPGVSEVFYYVS